MSPAGFVALLAGWVTTEVGRQPWVVYGLLRTADAVTPAVTAGAVATSLAAFVIVYGIIFPAGMLYMLRLVARARRRRARRAAAPAPRPAGRCGRCPAPTPRAGRVSGMTGLDLPLIWAAIIVLGVIMYVLLDGFDLGVGILFPYLGSDAERDVAMNSVAPIWDGNETWLVLGGAGLFAAFPLAYSVILPGTYLPLLIMLIALIFRGVAFSSASRRGTNRRWWDRAFHFGSLFATVAQGLVLGTFIRGFEVEGRAFAGGMLDWLTPFSLLPGLRLSAATRCSAPPG